MNIPTHSLVEFHILSQSSQKLENLMLCRTERNDPWVAGHPLSYASNNPNEYSKNSFLGNTGLTRVFVGIYTTGGKLAHITFLPLSEKRTFIRQPIRAVLLRAIFSRSDW